MSNVSVHKFLAAALDPLHIGVGGERLGRVDLTVVREPITNVPKVPGSSLSGAIKFFLDLNLRAAGIKTNICASTQGSDDRANNHDREKCPVCGLFGYATTKKSAQGILQFSDAMMLAYPVNTLCGPVWITTAPRLKLLCGIGDGIDNLDEKFRLADVNDLKKNPLDKKLNFGWVLLERDEKDAAGLTSALTDCGIDEGYASRFAIVSEWLFAQLINSNMEVRTSVVINPETGAADPAGLFTYEAVARGALFVFDITENDYRNIWAAMELAEKPDSPVQFLIDRSFPGIASVGLGGMTTRGFGRLQLSKLNFK